VGIEGSQLTALAIILDACAAECVRSPLGNLLEAHLKVVAADALLSAGYSILESANMKALGRVLSLRDGQLQVTLAKRPFMAPAPGSNKAKNSPDLRVWEPCRLVVELQVRSTLGSQSALFSDNLLDDLDRVRRGTADAFVLAADRVLYEALGGRKRDTRGRKAKHGTLLSQVLPPIESLGLHAVAHPWVTQQRGDLVVSGILVRAAAGVERCIVGAWCCPAP